MGAVTCNPNRWWDGAEIYSGNCNSILGLSQGKVEMLALYSSKLVMNSNFTGSDLANSFAYF